MTDAGESDTTTGERESSDTTASGRESSDTTASDRESGQSVSRASDATADSRSCELHRRLVEDSTALTAIVDHGGTVTYVNPAARRILGYEPDTMVGDDLASYVHSEGRDRIGRAVEQLRDVDRSADDEASGTDERVLEARFRTADDSWRWLEATLRSRVDDDVIGGVVVSARDVTARVERERQLRRQNDRLDEFASVVSHDLRNPLNVAKGRVDLLAAQYDSEHVPPVQRALGRMERIIEDTLTLAKQGQTVAETEPIRISELVSDCWATVDADAATVEVVDEFTFRGDRGRLRHVFENLFRNALEHGTTDNDDDDESRADDGDTAPGGSVTITVGLVEPFPTTTRGTGTVSKGIYVEDDGPGIPEEKRDTVFEPGHTSTDDGTGFGLTIVRRIAEAHGWEVDVGRGTRGGARFEFTDVTFADG